MGNIILSLVVNGMMAVLMFVTIMYCWRLNGRIKLLQDSKSELADIIREFDESTRRATESIAEIHAATSRLSENIQHKIDKANFLANDLDYLIEKGGKVTGRETTMATPRPTMPSARQTPQGQVLPQAQPAVQAQAAASTPAAQPAATGAGGVSPRRSRLRSRAEQELMQVLGNKDETGR